MKLSKRNIYVFRQQKRLENVDLKEKYLFWENDYFCFLKKVNNKKLNLIDVFFKCICCGANRFNKLINKNRSLKCLIIHVKCQCCLKRERVVFLTKKQKKNRLIFFRRRHHQLLKRARNFFNRPRVYSKGERKIKRCQKQLFQQKCSVFYSPHAQMFSRSQRPFRCSGSKNKYWNSPRYKRSTNSIFHSVFCKNAWVIHSWILFSYATTSTNTCVFLVFWNSDRILKSTIFVKEKHS